MAPYGARGNARGGRGGFGGGRGGFRGGRGGGRGGYGGPKLPSTLRDEVNTAYGSGSRGDEYSRKEKRKFAREEKKRPSTQPRYQPPPSDDEDEAEEDDEPAPPPKKSKPSVKVPEKPKKEKKKLPELTLPGEMVSADGEDQEIEWLEWMLKKEKGKGKEVDDDGLDDILDFADLLGPGGKGLKPSDLDDDGQDEDMFNLDETDDDLEGSDEEDDGSATGDVSSAGEEEEPWEGIVSDGGGSDGDGGEEGADSDGSSVAADEALNGDVDSDSASSKASTPAGQTEEAITASTPALESSIASAPTKYVPPHMRAAQLEEKAKGSKEKTEERIRLERKAQGLLNKLSEANLESILAEVEKLYREHSRNDVSTALTNLIIQMVSNKANLLDSFVALYATLVGALHRVIGMEFGAHFVHTLIMRYHNLSSDPSVQTAKLEANIYETPDASKEALNLLTLIAELYNAQVIGSKLIYDLVRGFLEENHGEEVMSERAVEGLLKVLRCSGAQLRTDDPASLKDIVNLVQEKTKGKEKTMTARARFLVETLTNVKNGKVRSNTGSEAGNEAATRMKKFLTGLGKKRRLLAYEPLRVSLSDLLSADKKGKWWLVGAGWSGNPLVEREEQAAAITEVQQKKKKRDAVEVNDEEALLDLARKQGMNTDVRRGVFVVLMTSEDYVHACDRLSLFKLTEVQQREFIRVALHCCGLEKTYNPYYTLILAHLCANSYDHRFTLQYALWDFMRELDEGGIAKVGKQRVVNVAKAVAYVVARGGLDLTVFKALDFTSLSSSLLVYLTTFLVNMLLALHTQSPIFTLPKRFSPEADFDTEGVEEKFEKTLSNTELAGGWLYVIERGMKGSVEDKFNLGERAAQVVQMGVKVAKKVLANAV
ncbi:hypothetical protein IAU60_003122 [Kwoniella sp. DSM 27419]